MANQKLYLYEATDEITKLGNSMATSYFFDGQELTVFWKGRKKSVIAHIGDVFFIECNGSMPEISKIKLPKNNYKLVLWLCGFYGYNSAIDIDKFKEIVENRRQELHWWGYREYGPEKEEYSLLLCNRSDCGGEYHVAGYIDKNMPLTKEKVIEILNDYYRIRWSYFPERFVKEILQKRFCMDETDLSRIHFE